jgi:hypothetical protein
MGRERQDEDIPADAGETDREAEASREALDEIPPPGTDPLHEGP